MSDSVLRGDVMARSTRVVKGHIVCVQERRRGCGEHCNACFLQEMFVAWNILNIFIQRWQRRVLIRIKNMNDRRLGEKNTDV